MCDSVIWSKVTGGGCISAAIESVSDNSVCVGCNTFGPVASSALLTDFALSTVVDCASTMSDLAKKTEERSVRVLSALTCRLVACMRLKRLCVCRNL